MSDLMRPLTFPQLMQWIRREYAAQQQIFGVPGAAFVHTLGQPRVRTPLGDALTAPLGPAAGPHSQMAQNIVASWLCGARFFELKTVQILDGQTIREAVHKPCIWAEDEGYNCEWSTELTVPEAYAEYVKAWFAIHVLAKTLGLADADDLAFNMSVGYDLAGIQSPRIDAFIESMKNASGHPVFQACRDWLLAHLADFPGLSEEDIRAIPAQISHSITLSTLHGTLPEEIEKISRYLLEVKKLDTFIKCNPTLLGYDTARQILDDHGYSYIVFDEHHFREDMQYADALAMIKRLRSLAAKQKLAFGLKLSNTFPVDVTRGELPAEEMYMSGRALHLLTLTLAEKLAAAFDGAVPLSLSGGADAFNVRGLLKAGISPVTVATTLLKPGGYQRLAQMAAEAVAVRQDAARVDTAALHQLLGESLAASRYDKTARHKAGSRKTASPLPLYDCFQAPCAEGGCPIGQQIPRYLKLVAAGKLDEAIRVITLDNPAPTITGKLCPQPCRQHCTRLDYEDALHMREAKLLAAEGAEARLSAAVQPAPLRSSGKVLVIGAGPAGMAAALFLRRNGVAVEVREKSERAYGLVSQVIPRFRISDAEIARDTELVAAYGVELQYGAPEAIDLAAEKAKYRAVILALGAHAPGVSPLDADGGTALDAMSVLRGARMNGQSGLAGRVCVVGGGDVAMDLARLAKREAAVSEVAIVYRRGLAEMPATAEDLAEAQAEGIAIHTFLQPRRFAGHTLTAEKMRYGDWDASGRRSVLGTGELVQLSFDQVVGATGARLAQDQYSRLGLAVDERGRARLSASYESSLADVYVIGDGRKGPSTIVQAIADARTAVRAILARLQQTADFDDPAQRRREAAPRASVGVLLPARGSKQEGFRCLGCDEVCEICTQVCPNRANVALPLPGMANRRQIVHIDRLCNECGNCAVFCPHAGKPYKDKWTFFSSPEDFADSVNPGWLLREAGQLRRRDASGTVSELAITALDPREQALLAALEANGMATCVKED